MSNQKYTVLDENDYPVAFYSSEIHDTLPDGAIAITDDQYQELLANSNTRQLLSGVVTAATAKVYPVTWTDMRPVRNGLLSASDWTQLPDAALTVDQKANYVTYRTTLRTLPQTYPDANTAVWPALPT